MAATTASAVPFTVSSKQEDEEKYPLVPLLEAVPMDALPLRFQRLLQLDPSSSAYQPPSSNTGQYDHPFLDVATDVKFYPGHIPLPPCFLFLLIALPGFLGLCMQSDKRTGTYWPGTGAVVVFAGLGLLAAIFANQSIKERAPLYAKDSLTGQRKPWPGDWKAGIYLVGSEALLDFDETGKVWVFPVQSIVRIEHVRRKSYRGNLNHELHLVYRSEKQKIWANGNGEITHNIIHIEDHLHSGLEIQNWHQRLVHEQQQQQQSVVELV